MNVEYVLRQVEPQLANRLVIHLHEGDNLIGSQMIEELTNYNKVSPLHGCVNKDGTDFLIRDLNSANGIYVNGIKISTENTVLEVWDLIGFGAPAINEGGFTCILTKIMYSNELKRENSGLGDYEENPQKKIKQEIEEHEPKARKVPPENEPVASTSGISNKVHKEESQEIEHLEADGNNLVKIEQEINETEDTVNEDNLTNISSSSVGESSDTLNKSNLTAFGNAEKSNLKNLQMDQSNGHINNEEGNDVGMGSSSCKASDETVEKSSNKNQVVAKESNLINANELEESLVNNGASSSSAVVQSHENYGSRISGLEETMQGSKKGYGKKTMKKNINVQVARKISHSEPVQAMETSIKNIHNEPHDEKSSNIQSECESSVSAVELQVGSSSSHLSKGDSKVTDGDNEDDSESEIAFREICKRCVEKKNFPPLKRKKSSIKCAHSSSSNEPSCPVKAKQRYAKKLLRNCKEY